MVIENARVLREAGWFEPDKLYVVGDRITDQAGGEVLDAGGCYAIPGLIDLHFHGCVGYDFSNGTAAEMNVMAEYQARNGITAICPATMTLPEQTLARACGRMAECASRDGAELVGINLEGPFISSDKLGAQNPEFVHLPDAGFYRRLQTASGGRVRLLAVAPETEGALELIKAVQAEVGCSLAHTTADYELARRALALGARQVTHLYNAMPPFTHREPGVVGAALDTPGCRVELICDNVHVHPSVVRATLRMFGDERVILISDSMMATGLDDGAYELGGLPVVVNGNRAILKHGGAIAGSVTNLMDCVRTAVLQMGVPLHTAVKCASLNPAMALGIDGERGSIAPGKVADLVLLNPDLSINRVILRGRVLH